jgi:hypothetical protein
MAAKEKRGEEHQNQDQSTKAKTRAKEKTTIEKQSGAEGEVAEVRQG